MHFIAHVVISMMNSRERSGFLRISAKGAFSMFHITSRSGMIGDCQSLIGQFPMDTGKLGVLSQDLSQVPPYAVGCGTAKWDLPSEQGSLGLGWNKTHQWTIPVVFEGSCDSGISIWTTGKEWTSRILLRNWILR
jgi:hypothetical protein